MVKEWQWVPVPTGRRLSSHLYPRMEEFTGPFSPAHSRGVVGRVDSWRRQRPVR